ncbi:hypothetical protein J1614_007174 [Plenodomus biglobosus]|nr:hypothetical protein J1614_007174 [Plenodomus biglobosus]
MGYTALMIGIPGGFANLTAVLKLIDAPSLPDATGTQEELFDWVTITLIWQSVIITPRALRNPERYLP